MLRVDGDTIDVGHRFRGHQLLLLLHPAVHIGVGGLGPPPPEGLGRPLRRPRAPRAVRAVHSCAILPLNPVSVLGPALSRQRTRAEDGFKGRFSRRLAPAQSQVHGLLLELHQVQSTGAALARLPVSVPGLHGGAAVDTEVVMEKHRQVARVLQDIARKWRELFSTFQRKSWLYADWLSYYSHHMAQC